MSRQRRVPTPTWERDRGIGGGLSGSRLQILAAVGATLLVLAAVAAIGIGFLSNYLQDRNRPNTAALTVGDTVFTVREFTNRSKLYVTQIGGTTNWQLIIPSVAAQLEEQAILLQYAGEKNQSATDDEVKAQIASLLGIEVTDANFDQRLADELKSSGLTDQQYRDMARTTVLRKKVTDQFQTELPATIESVHYRQITVADQATADDLKAQIEAGGDFAALATANSTDTNTKDKGGDAGWVPKGYLNSSIDNLLFSLDLNQVVTYASTSSVTIYQVTEKDDNRIIDDDKKSTLASQNYQKWLTDKKSGLTINNEVDLTTGNSDKLIYVIDHAGLTAQ
ncbi:MAG TPA: peptidylprolyl isomerase [Dehalococcoidia bacterium]|jgi:parvulin-like peptidyl-prolyl isomerase|nr:peptidylprolyl isomerase [Dehalococcoidia bacterium]